MNKYVLLCVLATVTHCIPIGVRELNKRDITPEKFKTIARALLSYKQFVPSDLVEELEEMMKTENAGETAQLFSFVSKIQSKSPVPEFDEIGRLLKKDAPKIFTRFARLFTSTVLRVMSLSEPAQKFFTESAKTPESKSNADHVRVIAGMKKRFDRLPSTVQAEFYVQFPEIMKFFGTSAYQSFINSLVELSDEPNEVVEAGLVMALQKMIKELMMMNQ